MVQGYLAGGERLSIRVRLAGDEARLNIKHARRLTVRHEVEVALPLEDARELLQHACELGQVEKTRYEVPHAGHVWEVDVFHGDNAGLVLAEIELAREGEPFEIPAWVGEDVSGDARYLNQNLAARPWRRWGAAPT
jgi:adenylate cyclase